MIYVSEETKQAFFNATQKNLVLTFDDGTVIDNDDIALESMNLEQTLCDNDELRYGKIASACFKTKIVASTKTYKNLWFNASIIAEKHEIKLGRFKVYTDNMTSDRLYRDIVAYDALFWAMNTDVTEWYNKIKFPITQRDFRNSLFAHLGIEQETVELPNDNIYLNRTSSAENLTGLTVLQKLCEINATWGVINNVGKFKYTRMRTHDLDALYPSENLYPSEDLYPNDIYDDRLAKGSYYLGSLKYAEYDTQPISKVTIREETDDLGYSYGDDGNTYVIENNLLMYGASDDVLEQVARNFYDYAQYISYTPSELSCKGAPWREVGDLLSVVADKRTLTVPILNRKLSGITALKDTYMAKGTETYGEVKNSPAEQLKKLQSRTNKITRTLDETRSEITRTETEIKTDGRNYLLDSEKETTGTIMITYALSSFKKQMNKQKLVLSFEAKSRETFSPIKISFGGAYKVEINEPNLENAYKKYVVSLPIVDDFTELKLIQIECEYKKGFYIRKAKLEIGENATDWTSAPEDLPNKFSNYSTTTEMNSVISQTAENIKAEVNKSVTETLGNYSTTTEMNSAILQTAESITSTVARNESKWIIDYETYTVDLFGFGVPSNDIAGSNIGKYYLDQETGALYSTIKNNENRYVWTKVAQFKSVQSDMYSKIEQNAYGITQKVSSGDVVSEINQSAEEILLKGNRVVIESDNFNLTKDGNIEILSGSIKIRGTVTRYASDYTEDDTIKINRITIGLETPTPEDWERLDINGDGELNALDAIIVTKLLNGELEKVEVPTSIEISPLINQSVIKTENVSVGMNGVFSKNLSGENIYFHKVYSMEIGTGYRQGVSGQFSTGDGKTITVTNGIITGIY